jgi:hypothetical protein
MRGRAAAATPVGRAVESTAVTTRTTIALRDRGWTNLDHPIADSGPCTGHRCDNCPECRGGTCCGSLSRTVNRDGNPALSPELHGPPTAGPETGA